MNEITRPLTATALLTRKNGHLCTLVNVRVLAENTAAGETANNAVFYATVCKIWTRTTRTNTVHSLVCTHERDAAARWFAGSANGGGAALALHCAGVFIDGQELAPDNGRGAIRAYLDNNPEIAAIGHTGDLF